MDTVKRELAELQTARVVLMCFLVIMLEGFDIQAAGVAAPKLAPAFGLTPAQMGTFFSASAVGVLLFAAIGGILGDRYGRKPVVIGATLAFGVACLLTPHCPNFSTLVIVRFLTGAGLGAAMPIVIAMTSDHSPASQKKRYVGIVYAAISLGGMICAGIMATGLLGADWRPIFYVGGVLPVAIAAAMVVYLPASRPKMAEVVGTGGSWADIVGARALPLTLALWVATFLTLAAMYTFVMWLPSLLKARGVSGPDALIIQTLYNLGSTVAAFVVGYLLDRKLVYSVATVGYLLLAAGLIGLGTVALDLPSGMLIGFVVGVAVTTGQTLLYAFAPLGYPAAVRNRGVGCVVAAGRLGTIVGPFCAGLLLTWGLVAGQVLISLVPVVLLALIAALLAARLLHGGEPVAKPVTA